jgi:hypothetical protein
MKEELLHFIWKYQLFNHKFLFTRQGEPLEIIHPGQHNHDSGPDFFNGRVKIGETIWAGNIEIHSKASDWFLHKHDTDPAYKNVILHVVYQDDLQNNDKYPDKIPVLELAQEVRPALFENYNNLMLNNLWIPCEQNVLEVNAITRSAWLERMVIERMETRYDQIIEIASRNKFDWSESFHVFLCRNFGFKVNSDAFQNLAEITPVKLLGKHKNNLMQVEALLFGQAGMLSNKFSDDYSVALKKEYDFLRKKYALTPMNPAWWKFSKLHPANFPTIRISQYANLIVKSSHLYSKLLEEKNLHNIFDLLDCQASDYWKYHYTFENITTQTGTRKIGKSSVYNLLINTVIPFLFIYGKEKGQTEYINRALNLLEQLPEEKNRILEKFESLGFVNKNASVSQALLHLKKHYCVHKRCLDCSIGVSLIRTKTT